MGWDRCIKSRLGATLPSSPTGKAASSSTGGSPVPTSPSQPPLCTAGPAQSPPTWVIDHVTSWNPKAFIMDVLIPGLNLPAMTGHVPRQVGLVLEWVAVQAALAFIWLHLPTLCSCTFLAVCATHILKCFYSRALRGSRQPQPEFLIQKCKGQGWAKGVTPIPGTYLLLALQHTVIAKQCQARTMPVTCSALFRRHLICASDRGTPVFPFCEWKD